MPPKASSPRSPARPAAKKTPARPLTPARPKTPAKPRRATAAIDFYHLRLYIAGQTRKSLQAVANLRKICEAQLPGRYSIEVVDLLEHPELARSDQILAIPTLVRRLPAPVKKIIGDLSQTDKVLLGLNVELRAAGD